MSGQALGVVLKEDDLEEVIEVAAEDEFIGEEDKVGIGPTFGICLGTDVILSQVHARYGDRAQASTTFSLTASTKSSVGIVTDVRL